MADLNILPQGLRLKEALQKSWLLPTSEPLQIGSTPSEVIFQEGPLRVLKFISEAARHRAHPRAYPLIIVPSLINRYYILDLLPGRSLIEHFLAQGFDVYVVEWGLPEDEDRWLSLDRLISGRLRRAMRASLTDFGAEQAHVVGHCLGGTVATLLGMRYPELFQSLTLLTTPVNFRSKDMLSIWSNNKCYDVGALIEAYGNVPWPMLQSAFHLMKPATGFAKYLRFASHMADPTFFKHLMALEIWGADNVSFPGDCYRSLIETLYRQNALVEGKIRVAGKKLSLATVSFPVLDVCGDGDHIVLGGNTVSADTVKDQVSDLTSWTCRGSHIGAILGKRAQNDLWPRLTDWLGERDVPTQ